MPPPQSKGRERRGKKMPLQRASLGVKIGKEKRERDNLRSKGA